MRSDALVESPSRNDVRKLCRIKAGHPDQDHSQASFQHTGSYDAVGVLHDAHCFLGLLTLLMHAVGDEKQQCSRIKISLHRSIHNRKSL